MYTRINDRTQTKKIFIIPIYGIAFAIGIVVGIFINKFLNMPYFTVDKNINIINLLSILCTIALGLYINLILSKNNEICTHVKKMYIEKLNELENINNSIIEKIDSGTINFYSFINKTTYIKKTMKRLKNHKVISPEECLELIEKIMLISDKCSESNKYVKIRDGTIEFSGTEKNEIIDDFHSLNDDIFEIKFSV